METIKVTHSEETVFHTAYGKFMTLIKNVYKGTLIYASKLSSTEFISNISTILIFWFGASLITSNRLTVGTLISFYMIMSFFTEPIQRLIDTQQSIQSAGVALERLEDILQSASEENVDTSYSIVPETELKGDISIDNIVFRYGNRNTVLQNTSLHISANSCIAIVGESGSGKTTLARLLLRFYQPESGSITIDDKPIESFPLDQLRNDIAYISQNPQFFTGTIRYNLNLSGNHSDEQLIQMCSRCHLDSFISSQPNGLDFMIEESGKNLSAGQKQRLAIARALLQKPHILILDEATSNLDTLTEQSIQALLTECKKDLTIIVIAHRLSTIRNCDHIFVLSKGTIVEEGSHDELMKANGTYASFWHIP